MSSNESAKTITGKSKTKPEFTVNYGFFNAPPQEHSDAPDHKVESIEQPDLDSKFAIERDYIDKTFEEIEGDMMADDDLEASLTRLAYDERNMYVM